MMDVDRYGKIGFEELKKMWIEIRKWKDVLRLYEKDKYGCLSEFEMSKEIN